MSGEVYDVIVIGAGIVGSATAYHLAKDNKRTLLLEQFPLPHTRGSSHGQSRATRKAYVQTHYAEMMEHALNMWDVLEHETGTKLFHKTGMLLVSKPGSPFIIDRDKALTGDQIQRQYPMLKFDDDVVGIFEYDAGVLFADKCLHSFQKMFIHHRGEIKDGEGVQEIIPGDIITVHTSKSHTYQARSIVITAGPWTNKVLAPLGLTLPLQPQKIPVYYWKQKEENYSANNFPVFVVNVGDGIYYGLPALEYPQHVKICNHSGEDIDPDRRDISDSYTQCDDKLLHSVAQHFPHLENRPSIIESCIYTWTPDADFILDTHPEHKNIVIGTGFSGHGFKLAPVVGKILSQLSCKQQPMRDLHPFRLNRFQQYKSKL